MVGLLHKGKKLLLSPLFGEKKEVGHLLKERERINP